MTDGPTTPEQMMPPDPCVLASKTFISTYFGTPTEDRPRYGSSFDISDPKHEDIEKIRIGAFELTNFRTTPRGERTDKQSYHFYVGETEFHLTGEAADAIDAIIEAAKSDNMGSSLRNNT